MMVNVMYTYVYKLSKTNGYRVTARHIPDPDWHQWVDFYNRLKAKDV